MPNSSNVPCGYLALGDDQKILDCNEEAERLIELPRAQIVGLLFSELLPLKTRAFFTAHIYPSLAVHGALREVYLSLRKADGTELATLMNVVRRPIDGTMLIECAFMAMQRRRLFESELIEGRRSALEAARAERAALLQLQEAQTRLAAQDQLASLGMLAAGVAHEINNPLAYVAANLELLGQCVERDAHGELRGMLAEAKQGVTRIRDIVGSLRALSRIEEQERLVPVDLCEVARLASQLAGVQIRHVARFEISAPEHPVLVDGDAGRLGQVVVNLLVNAAQAVPEGNAGNLIRLSVMAEDGAAIIEVQDNGPGIPEDLAHRIFDPFFTTKPLGMGTGLGLSICKGIVTALGGTLMAENKLQSGACFRVQLPLSAAQRTAEERSENAVVATPEPHKQLRVLVIDDDEHVARVLSLSLRGFDVAVTQNAADALALCRTQDFDVILCDLMMPHVSGIELHRELARSRPELARRMIFLTGGSFSADTDMFLATVQNPCIRKPFAIDTLRKACTEVAQAHARR